MVKRKMHVAFIGFHYLMCKRLTKDLVNKLFSLRQQNNIIQRHNINVWPWNKSVSVLIFLLRDFMVLYVLCWKDNIEEDIIWAWCRIAHFMAPSGCVVLRNIYSESYITVHELLFENSMFFSQETDNGSPTQKWQCGQKLSH